MTIVDTLFAYSLGAFMFCLTIGRIIRLIFKQDVVSNFFAILLLVSTPIMFITGGIKVWKGEDEKSKMVKTNNGNLDNTFKAPKKLISIKDSLLKSGWKEEQLSNGQMPSCYNFKPKHSKINNYLKIYVGSGTDVAIKLMSKETNKCIRYVFINSKTSYEIKHIPEGSYYLMIAYGKGWLSSVYRNRCIGKFTLNPLYEKGLEVLDFHIKREQNSYKIPSYNLSLDVIQTQSSNNFNSSKISEEEFNI